MTFIVLEARTRSLTFIALEARAHVQRALVRNSRGAKIFIAAKRGDRTDAPERPKYTSTRHNRSIVVEFHQKTCKHQKMQMARFHVCHGRAQSSPLRVLPRSDPLGGPLGEYFVQLRPASIPINQASNRPRGREGPQNEHCGSHFSELQTKTKTASTKVQNFLLTSCKAMAQWHVSEFAQFACKVLIPRSQT